MAARLPLCSSPMAAPFMGSRVGCLTTSKMVMMCSKNHTHTRSSTKNKIFEDRSAGIVCYRDENGEITCEGYDEGPRFHQSISRFNQDRRDVEIIELLQRCWLQVAEDNGGET
ncbi:uncharacterized protein LOC125187596 [Salvia hispanica]|uniref:uncharacterized protein LOC125187596 n=1 Tax=Salvia hispanica TaxID=49212 RepID=UPI0020099D3D|nr:uncharacterized protein LOC125187596 [Salvia hispanica]